MVASYKFGQFRLEAEAEALFCDAEPVALGRRAVALLRVLVDRPGALISKDELIQIARRIERNPSWMGPHGGIEQRNAELNGNAQVRMARSCRKPAGP
jgi:hypothetical protein